MKILHIINSLNTGGAEKLLSDELPILNQTIDIEVLVLDDFDSSFKRKLIDSKVSVFGLNTSNIKSIKNIRKIRKFIKNYDIIHSHLFPSQYWVALANILLFNKRKILITTEHSTDNRRRSIPVFKYIDRFIYRQYDKIISISDGTAIALSQYLNTTKNIVTIQNGIDIDSYKHSGSTNRSNFGLSSDDFLLIMVARFSYQKDQDTLIKSLLELPTNVKLLLVGDGERKSICESLVDELGLKDRVIFLGQRNDIPQLLKMANISVTSSHIEGFGLAAVEAMASGIPVVASNISGLSEVVGQAGLLFNSQDFVDLARQIRMLYDDEKLYSVISEKCQMRSYEFSIAKMVESTIGVYNELYDLKYRN